MTSLRHRAGHMARARPVFPKFHGQAHIYGGHMFDRIIAINRNDLRPCGAAKGCGPHRACCHRPKRQSDTAIARHLALR
ncbi:hypothetical protein [uncultured Tateyamaria sp.]|uniref:hypothetical protein n=1 Tax=Tateyamaria sp. 1078 TaxID=3417464 RepID=UPI0026314655|nr:hypothetical protein [uncultured Tateyamaria sp.]